MKLLCLCLGVTFSVILFLSGFVLADNYPSLIISEIKIKNDTAGYNEFIELYNTGLTSLDLNKFTIEYFNSPAPAENAEPVKQSIPADGLLLPNKTIVLAVDKQQIPDSLDSPFSSLSDSGGLVRISDQEGNIQDEFAWTSTSSLAIAPVVFLSTSTTNRTKSFIRDLDDQGNPVLVNPTWQLLTPAPQSNVLQPAPKPEPEPETPPSETPQTDTENQVTETPLLEVNDTGPVLLPPQITELLPNPAPPANDSTDEYIELYNPNDEAIDLNEYRLQSGNSYSYNYTFKDDILAPKEYKAFYVMETGALLANSGGRARLLDPSGEMVSETSPYDDAAEGQTWSLINGNWQWTTTPTPGSVNILSLPAAKAIKAVKAATTKTSKPKAAPKAKTAAAKKTTKPKSTTATKSGNSSGDDEEIVSGIHPAVIAGVGLAALAYAAYEYRFDVRNLIYQLQRYRTNRTANRAKS